MSEARTLITLLEDAEALLRTHGVEFWAEWLARDVGYLRADEFFGVEDLLGAFGGMGSFNDLVIHPGNGHDIEVDEAERANRRLDELRTAIYTSAGRIKAAGHLPR